MTTNELIKQLLLTFNSSDKDAFLSVAREYIEREKRMKHTQVAKELEKALFEKNGSTTTFVERRFKNDIPIPRDSEKGFPLLEIRNYEECFENLVINVEIKEQIEQIIREFRDSDILATYNISHKKKILLCGKPGTGKTFTAQIVSSLLNIPLVCVRFDAIISSYLGETASNLRKVFDFIEHGTWIVLFDEFDIIGKNRDDNHEHGEIKRVVNNFLQMMDGFNGNSILFAATNHQYLLDSAIWRRFDDVLFYDLPSELSRKKLIENYLKPLNRAADINIDEIVKRTEGLSPSDIKMIATEAMKLSIIDSRNVISGNDLDTSLTRFAKREKLRKNSSEEII